MKLQQLFPTLMVVAVMPLTGCTSGDRPQVERVADSPVVKDAQDIAVLLEEATGTCTDFGSPTSVKIRGIDEGTCTFMEEEIYIRVFTDGKGRLSGRPDVLRGGNWMVSGELKALEIAEQALEGTIADESR